MKKCILITLILSLVLFGCGEKEVNEKPKVLLEHYNKAVYEPSVVIRGDIVPESVLLLNCNSLERETYSLLLDGMQVDTVHVKEGDIVKKGDLLISCKADDIEKKIIGYKKKIEQNQMLYDHYNSLILIENSDYYDNLIKQLERSIEVDELYVLELETKLQSYFITAQADGIVLNIADGLDNASVNAKKNIITMIYSDGIYTGDSKEEFDFEPGEIYEAYYGITAYPLQLISEERNNGISHYVFQNVVSGNSFCSKDKLQITITKETLKNVLYIPESCIRVLNEETYVYLLDDRGYLRFTEVKTGNTVDGKTVILSGIQEGDKVVER